MLSSYNSISSLKKVFNLQHHVFYRRLTGLNLWNEELSTEIKHKIEEHWADKIKARPFDENGNKSDKYYVLSMFPYPSGQLHMGHVRVYTISDAVARFQRMNGKNVIHPIGWDAFGLPAENAAIERNIPPDNWTNDNIKQMKVQLEKLGCSFEWERVVSTCNPDYYKWTQQLFIMLHERGLVYQKEAIVNWDPVDKTVLADEQVDENGCSWRSGAKVEKKPLRQWFIRTTQFAKSLFDGLNDETLQDWRDIIKLQRHWIGNCDGISIDFKLNDDKNTKISLWTDNMQYINEAKFIVISPAHILANRINTNSKVLAINPINNESIPVYVSDNYEFLEQTDSHIGIPAVVEKDKEFALKHNIAFNEDGINCVNIDEVCKKLQRENCGGYYSSAKLRDWLISRQRYWGTPIPIINCNSCGPVVDKNIPVKLPEFDKKALEKGATFDSIDVNCPKCGQLSKRETDTMDTFVDSSWYFLRYIDPKNSKEMFDVNKAMKMTPVDLYIGGKEHAVLHLYYARFISHFLHSLGLLPEREPFKRLLVQGMVMGRSYRIKGTGQYLPENQVNVIDLKRNKAVDKNSGKPVVMQWEKMSKSKFNGVAPTDMFNEYSVDTIRLLMLADVAPTSHRNWNSNTFPGILQWQRRLWLTIKDFIKHRNEETQVITDELFKEQDEYMFDSRNFYVKGATFNYCNSQQISVAISKMQGLTNSIRRAPPAVFARSVQFERALACQIIMLAPIAPHFASELWSGFVSVPNRLNNSNEILWDKSVLEQHWPDVDYHYNLDLVLNVNGTEISVVKMPRKEIECLKQEDALDIALKDGKVLEALSDRKIMKTSYVVHKGYEVVLNISAKSSVKEAENQLNNSV